MTAAALSPTGYPGQEAPRSRFWLWVVLSVAAHLVLFAILSLSLLQPPETPPPPQPMDVTIADDVGLKAAAPQAVTPPAQSRAPVIDKPEEAAAPAEVAPEPAPPKPQPEAAPPPRPAPPQPAPPKPQPVARPEPAKVKPAPKAPAKPEPKKETAPATKTVAKAETKKAAAPAAKPAPRAPAKPAPAAPSKSTAKPTAAKGSGASTTSTKPRASGAALGDIMKGISAEKSTSTTVTPKAAVMSQTALMDIGAKIKQQVQPCANRQVNPGPGAEKIRVVVRLHINKDGSLRGQPEIVDHDGVDDDNRRYLRQVDDRAIATFMGCQPLRGLPPDLYSVPNGWSNFLLRYKLPG